MHLAFSVCDLIPNFFRGELEGIWRLRLGGLSLSLDRNALTCRPCDMQGTDTAFPRPAPFLCKVSTSLG